MALESEKAISKRQRKRERYKLLLGISSALDRNKCILEKAVSLVRESTEPDQDGSTRVRGIYENVDMVFLNSTVARRYELIDNDINTELDDLRHNLTFIENQINMQLEFAARTLSERMNEKKSNPFYKMPKNAYFLDMYQAIGNNSLHVLKKMEKLSQRIGAILNEERGP